MRLRREDGIILLVILAVAVLVIVALIILGPTIGTGPDTVQPAGLLHTLAGIV